MSQENVEIVRRFTEPHEGDDITAVMRAAVERLGPDPEPDYVLAFWAEDPSWRYAHPEIEWDGSATGSLGAAVRGPREVTRFWAEWTEVWKSYVYRIVEYRDLNGWVLTTVDVHARGSGDIPLEMRIFQIWQVRDEKIAVMRSFLSEPEALEAAGLSE